MSQDGKNGVSRVPDTDAGRIDGDPRWDRAVGPMQFLPSTWAYTGVDADGDGARNPDDIDDSALGSAVYLCGAGGSLADPAGAARAAFRYNHSDYYVQLVLSFQTGYQTGVFAVPSPPPPATKHRWCAGRMAKSACCRRTMARRSVSIRRWNMMRPRPGLRPETRWCCSPTVSPKRRRRTACSSARCQRARCLA